MTKGACTPLYAAPEVMNMEPYDEKCDVWSAGLILYEMLTGKEYFRHVKTRAQLIEELKKFKGQTQYVKYPKELHKQWEVITGMMLVYNPIKRKNFSELFVEFGKIEPKMREELRRKYNEQEDKEEDNHLELAKSISPYLAR